MPEIPEIETFENDFPEREYEIRIVCPEFTSVCPRTGQPDFGKLVFTYCPGELCVELKALKFYLQSYRDKGIFYEHATNTILDDFVRACSPRWARVVAAMNPRGGISTTVTCEYKAPKAES